MRILEKVRVSILLTWQPSRDHSQLSSSHMNASFLSLIFCLFSPLSPFHVFNVPLLFSTSLSSQKLNESFPSSTTLEAE